MHNRDNRPAQGKRYPKSRLNQMAASYAMGQLGGVPIGDSNASVGAAEASAADSISLDSIDPEYYTPENSAGQPPNISRPSLSGVGGVYAPNIGERPGFWNWQNILSRGAKSQNWDRLNAGISQVGYQGRINEALNQEKYAQQDALRKMTGEDQINLVRETGGQTRLTNEQKVASDAGFATPEEFYRSRTPVATAENQFKLAENTARIEGSQRPEFTPAVISSMMAGYAKPGIDNSLVEANARKAGFGDLGSGHSLVPFPDSPVTITGYPGDKDAEANIDRHPRAVVSDPFAGRNIRIVPKITPSNSGITGGQPSIGPDDFTAVDEPPIARPPSAGINSVIPTTTPQGMSQGQALLWDLMRDKKRLGF